MPLHPGYFLLEQIVEKWKFIRRKKNLIKGNI
jgi:hypothetical protein